MSQNVSVEIMAAVKRAVKQMMSAKPVPKIKVEANIEGLGGALGGDYRSPSKLN